MLRSGPCSMKMAQPPNNPSIHGGLNERCVPTDTLTGVDGQMGEVGDTAAGLWNEYGWSLLALKGQTDGR